MSRAIEQTQRALAEAMALRLALAAGPQNGGAAYIAALAETARLRRRLAGQIRRAR